MRNILERLLGKKIQVEPKVITSIEEQKLVSKKTLQYVQDVLDRKDELLAEAINQTGEAIQAPQRVRSK